MSGMHETDVNFIGFFFFTYIYNIWFIFFLFTNGPYIFILTKAHTHFLECLKTTIVHGSKLKHRSPSTGFFFLLRF